MAKVDWDVDAIAGAFAAAAADPSMGTDPIEIASGHLGASGAAALSRLMSFARAEAAMTAFDIGPIPALMLDQFGFVSCINQSAQRVLGPDLFICQRRLRSARQHETNALDKAIQKLLRATDPILLPPLVITRAEGRPVLLCLSRPMRTIIEASTPCRG